MAVLSKKIERSYVAKLLSIPAEHRLKVRIELFQSKPTFQVELLAAARSDDQLSSWWPEGVDYFSQECVLR